MNNLFIVGQQAVDVTAVPKAQKTLEINWKDPVDPLGLIDYFLIQITAEGEAHEPVKVMPEANNRPATVNTLTPFKEYSIQIVTVNKQLNEHGGQAGQPTPAIKATTWPARKNII